MSPQDPTLPDQVRQVAQASVQILYPKGRFSIVRLSETNPFSREEWWSAAQYEVCKLQSILNCPIADGLWSGTGFFLSPKTMATNLHNIQSWSFEAIKANPGLKPEDIIQPIILMDSEHNVVGFAIKQPCRLSFFNNGKSVWSQSNDGSLPFRVSDYVELTCENMNPTAIPKVSADRLSFDEDYFLIGFPNKTDQLEKFGEKDSPGNTLLVSVGRPKKGVDLTKFNVQFEIAAAPGSSGSMLVNKKGEAVGILFAGTIEEANGKLQRSGNVLQLINPESLREIWKTWAP